ncbi:hypothetical protein BK133_04090 [Paenibacillus sp. FSL H8-0548]|uniref:sigma-70 family RNA polymerase sigma factor n=1 Tax=Paenibacillus sp. FSL H8-0548 TaxID=1920422 RepID=UPI00096CE459|nr:sigma-70 family RNA polymerase sigma factor [Paenibacillus sp. FSL H8-0548]OMF37726.1 hypothetical protein BK133_04090 [Paenibacillus sp. FSL H8-0548]
MRLIDKLVKKAQKGDTDAFTRLFVQNEADIYRIAFVYVRHEQDALDVVQETAYRSFKGIAALKKPAYFKTWIIRIAISSAIDLLRRRNKITPMEDSKGAHYHTTAVEENVVTVSLSLQPILDLLDEEEKGVILLRYYKDYTIREVSEILNIPLGTAKTLLYRALSKLRTFVREEDYYE